MKRKKIINSIIVIFISIFLACTYFSRTVKNILLPMVTVVNSKSGVIGDGFETEGTIVKINSQNLNSDSSPVDSRYKFAVNFDTDLRDGNKFSIGGNVDVLIKIDEKANKEKKVKAIISQKDYDSEKGTYMFSAKISDVSDLKAGEKVTISFAEETKRYDNVIPKRCLTKEDGLDYVYVLNTDTSALSGGYCVQKVQVKVIASDSTNCAIKSPEGGAIPKNYGIVLSSSKPIENNSEVKLDTES